MEEIVKKQSALHEQDLARLVSAHFSDVLQQIQDNDTMDDGEDYWDDDADVDEENEEA